MAIERTALQCAECLGVQVIRSPKHNEVLASIVKRLRCDECGSKNLLQIGYVPEDAPGQV